MRRKPEPSGKQAKPDGALKSDGDVRIEYLPLSKLVGAPRNPKQHDVGTLIASIKRFGYVAPVVLNESTGRIVAGHGRVEALRSMKASGQPKPGRMEERDGEWLVPVVRGVSFASEAEAEAYLIADNQLVLSGGGWDDAQLAALLSDLKASDAGLEGIGFDGDDLDEILRNVPESIMPELPSGDRDGFREMTFTLTDSQAERIESAIKKAKQAGDFTDTGNENSNGNALAIIAEAYLA